ncbi:thermonuclease family protein [Mesorhizobium sp.]|uniref:thermonuclease family protein n=1 Tax=Mesorhizobium sp. TaxID=1871066 RepID=UPI00257C116A|nr:thermonuclease family protein [Mesorhizobium sp.]
MISEANRVFEDVRAMVRWARGRGDLDSNLVEGMRRPTETTERDRVLSAGEIRTMWVTLADADMRESTASSRILNTMIRSCVLGLAVGLLAIFLAPVTVMAEKVSGDRIVIIDGDTIALPCAVPARGCAEKIRLLGIDTPEARRPRCENELRLGLAAKLRLAGLLRGHPVDIDRSGRKDRYRRALADLKVEGIDVGTTLIVEGHALAYRTGAEARLARLRLWCGPAAELDDVWKGS